MRYLNGFLLFSLAAAAGAGLFLAARYGGGLELPVLQGERVVDSQVSLDVIEDAKEQLAKLVQANVGTMAGDHVAQLLEDVDAASDVLEQDKNLETDQLHEARRSILVAHYSAVVIDRARFAGSFDQFAQRLIAAHSGSALAKNAEMLRLVASHDYRQGIDQEMLSRIDKFAAEHGPRQGASLYEVVAGELVRHGRPRDAKALVRHGIDSYQASPLVVSKLVNLSADLELSKPPPPRYTQAQFDAMMRVRQTRSRARPYCPPRRA